MRSYHNKDILKITLFDEYLCRINHTEKKISESVIEDWIKEVSAGISANTSSLHVHYIRQLLLYLIDCGYPCFIPRTVRKKDTYVPYLYSDKDIEKIFKAADSLTVSKAVKNVLIEKEMPLILRLLFCCGLRVGETLNIKVGDVDFRRNLIILRVTKKYKQRLVPYEEDLSEIIYRYCVAMGILNDSEAYLFPAEDKYSHVSANSVEIIIELSEGKQKSAIKTVSRMVEVLACIALDILLLLDHLIKMSAMG